jgi:hypothetical protein
MMSTGEWLTIIGMLLTIAVFGGTVVVGAIGYFLTTQNARIEKRLDGNERRLENVSRRQTVTETVLADRGLMPRKTLPFPSPPKIGEEDAG